VGVELPDAGHEGGEVTLDLGQADVDAGVGVGTARRRQQVGQVAEAVADGIEDGRLEADGVAESVEGVEEPGHGRLALGGERPLKVAPLELLRRGVVGRPVLRGLEEAPPDQRVERPGEDVVGERLVPPGTAERGPDLVEVEGGGENGRLLEHAHESDVEIPQVSGREPEQVRIRGPPEPPSIGHEEHHKQGV
jgi:hypothetical protein